ncbi:Prostaglandin reductase 1 [Trichinella pseudospiralis]|uniref:Prostaglandin reductase 1 n=1 Tax=Trichinella pseudospiralis TaxID=6337 RepID=A0A0V1J960_TRIPS|nr:Prostaglandin reductase 1 [Trichinella pseudospiralis]
MTKKEQTPKTVTAQRWIVMKPFDGYPKLSDFAISLTPLRKLQTGEFRCKGLLWSVEPFTRVMDVDLNSKPLVQSLQVAEVVESRNPAFSVGSVVIGYFGWCTDCITNGQEALCKAYHIGDLHSLPLSASVGAFGLSGIAAYVGFVERCNPQLGSIVVVNAAAGGVGHLVCQMAMFYRCVLIAFVGSDEKVNWLKTFIDAKFVYNYKTVDVGKLLDEIVPDGVDIFFDSVGGEFANKVMVRMKKGGRMCLCGTISDYNDTKSKKDSCVRADYGLAKRRGFIIRPLSALALRSRWPDLIPKVMELFCKGAMRYREQRYMGFENLPQALIDQLNGDTFVLKKIKWGVEAKNCECFLQCFKVDQIG